MKNKPKIIRMAVPKDKSAYPRIRKMTDAERFGDKVIIDIQYRIGGEWYRYYLKPIYNGNVDKLMSEPSRGTIIKFVKDNCYLVRIFDKTGDYLKQIKPDK